MSQIVTNVTNAAFSYLRRLETERFNSAIDHLTKFTKEKPDRILDDKKCYSSLLLIGKTIYSHSENIDYPFFVQSRFDNVISNYLNEIFKIRLDMDFQTRIDWRNAENAVRRNEILAQIFTYVIYITNEILIRSFELCSLFVQNNGLCLCLEFLKDNAFLNKNKYVKIIDSGNPLGIADSFTMIMANLVCTCDEQKHKWKSLNAADILLKITNSNSLARLKYNSYFTLAHLLDDNQIETLVENDELNLILGSILKCLLTAHNDYEENKLNRLSIQINFKGKPIECRIHHVNRGDGISTSIRDILVCLYKLAVNDTSKCAIYFDENVKGCFRIFLEKGKFLNNLFH